MSESGRQRRDPTVGLRPSDEELLQRQLEELERTGTGQGEDQGPQAAATESAQTQRSRPTGRANRLAVTAFIIAFVPGLAIPAIVLGWIAGDEIAESSGAERGSALAQWAMVIGVIQLAATILVAASIIANLD